MTPSSLTKPLAVEQAQAEIAMLVLAQNELRNSVVRSRLKESVTTIDLLGRVFAENVVSPINVPSHDNSAMDGFAFAFADLNPDTETVLNVVGTSFAGDANRAKVSAGQAIKVMTGAMMPFGTDTVVPFENANAADNEVTIPTGQKLGQNRRFAGEDLAMGKAAVHAGRRCTASDMGLIASLGISSCLAHPKIKVALLSTGDELTALGSPLLPGKIYDSNRFTLTGLLVKLGVEIIDLGIIPDNPDALETALKYAAQKADVIISSGGVSVGEADFTRTVMNRLGSVDFCTVAMRPGRPIAIGRLHSNEKSALYFGLPGNPVAVMVTFYFFVQDAIRQLAGETVTPLALVKASAQTAFRKKSGRTEYQRAIYEITEDRQAQVRTTGGQGSGVLSSMSSANCLVVLHHEQTSIDVGDTVDVVLFDSLD
jgi:molybdopterin molybdotransferase